MYYHPFAAYADNKPVMGLFSESKCMTTMASARIQCWALTMPAYQYHIVYKAGSENANANAFSYLSVPESLSQFAYPQKL